MIERAPNFTADKVHGQDLWHMGDGWYVGVDRGAQERHVEVGFRRMSGGRVEDIDVREYPASDAARQRR